MDIRNNPSSPKPTRHNLADFTRPNRDAIERGTPGPEEIRERNAANQANVAERREAVQEKQLAERIDLARGKHAERVARARRQSAAEGGGDVVDIDPAVAEADGAERERMVEDARAAARAHAARTELAQQARRAYAAREQTSERAEEARNVLAEEARRAFAAREQMAERAQDALDRVSLSDTSLRMRAEAQPADARAERLAELKALHEQGRLNSDELIARAAHNMLSGE